MPAPDLRDFSVDLSRMTARFWRLIGEAKSKCQHLDQTPLLPAFQQKMLEMALIRGVQATTAIEGNTLTEDEVRAIYENRSQIPASRQYLEQEVRNVLDVFNAEVHAPRVDGDLTLDRLCDWNTQILKGLTVEDHVTPGVFRTRLVRVGNYVCPPANEVPELMEHFVNWYNNTLRETPPEFHSMEMAIIKAMAAHIYFVMVHPFGDGNGRTARLIEWFTLDRAGISTTAAHLLSNHYNLTRTMYTRMLDEGSLGGDLRPFLTYAVSGLVDQLAEQLTTIYYQYTTLVYAETARHAELGETRHTADRRRELAVAIALQQRPVPAREMRVISSSLAEQYQDATQKTITRDLHALQEANLIGEQDGGWIPLVSTLYWGHRRRPLPAN